MTRSAARLILLLYPLAFRRRYGQEMQALLQDTTTRPAVLLDLLRGALTAHLRAPARLEATVSTGERLRASMSGVLACWVAFAAAGFGFYKTTEDNSYEGAASAHPLLGDAHLTIQVLAVIASISVVAGALPLVLAAIGQARHRPSLRSLVSIPVVAVILLAALTAGLILLAHSQHPHQATSAGKAAFIAWELAALICGAVCVIASRRALFAVPIPRIWLLVALACATLVSAAMLAMATATAIYTTALALDAPTLAGAPNGPLGITATSVSLIQQLVVMFLAGALAITTTRRGWRSANRPDIPETA